MSRQPDPHPEWSGLLAAAQEGDREAYGAFLQAVIPFLRETARHRAADADEAERMVRAALLSVHRLRHTYDPRRPVAPWLAGILAAHRPRPRAWRLGALWARPGWSAPPAPKLRPT
jgi:hypothetical protein